MKHAETIPNFDCVEMKRKGASRIYEALKDLTPEEEDAYWERRNQEFRERMAERRGDTVGVKLAS